MVLIKEENRPKIQALLDEVQQNARVRCIKADDIFFACEMIEKRLDIPKSKLKGIIYQVDPNATVLPNAYKYTMSAESTQFTLTHTGSGWKLLSVERKPLIRRKTSFSLEKINEETTEALIHRIERF